MCNSDDQHSHTIIGVRRSMGDRGVLPTRPRNRWGYALFAHKEVPPYYAQFISRKASSSRCFRSSSFKLILVRIGANQMVLTPFCGGIWNRLQVSVADRGVLPTRPRNHRGYALLAHTFGKMRSCVLPLEHCVGFPLKRKG